MTTGTAEHRVSRQNWLAVAMLALCFFALSGPTAAPYALSAEEDTAASAQATNDADTDTDTDNQQKTPATPEKQEPAADEDSPFDYKSSEEISEDLSVSYPVDI